MQIIVVVIIEVDDRGMGLKERGFDGEIEIFVIRVLLDGDRTVPGASPARYRCQKQERFFIVVFLGIRYFNHSSLDVHCLRRFVSAFSTIGERERVSTAQ